MNRGPVCARRPHHDVEALARHLEVEHPELAAVLDTQRLPYRDLALAHQHAHEEET